MMLLLVGIAVDSWSRDEDARRPLPSSRSNLIHLSSKPLESNKSRMRSASFTHPRSAQRLPAVNGFGWGPASPPVKFKTLRSEVEVTGVQTQDERDEEAKKRAVDVDAADEPEAKRAK